MKEITFVLALVASFRLAQPAMAQSPGFADAIEKMEVGDYATTVAILEQLLLKSPTEQAYYALGNAHSLEQNWEKAAAAYAEGAAKFPLSARLHNGAAFAYEQQMDPEKASLHYRKAIAIDPRVAYMSAGRYDWEFDAMYIPVVHDHRGKGWSCSGRLYVYDNKLHYVVYIDVSGGQDDSFETLYSNIENVEVDRKTASRDLFDYSIFTRFAKPTTPRRRPTSDEPIRLDLKFVFKQPITGYRGKPWDKEEIKLFFVEPEVAERFIKFLESKGIKTSPRS